MMAPVFQQFAEKKPLCVLSRIALEKLFDAKRLDEVFRSKAKWQYHRELLFSQVFELMMSVVLRVKPTVHAAYLDRKEELGVSDQAIYDKLRNLEPGITAALIEDSAKQLTPVIDALQSRHPAWVPGYKAKVIDGNHLAATERRIKELRTKTSGPLPGTVLAVYEQETDLVTKVFLIQDGHAQERSVLDEVLQTVESNDLWIADRNFCTKDFLMGIGQANGFFVVRQHGGLLGTEVGMGSAEVQVEGGKVSEVEYRLSQGETGLGVRRITLALSEETRDRDKVIQLLTNLPDEISAAKIAEVYRKRWTIERRFYEVTQTLNCEPNTLGYPQAALFAFCLALIASNAVALIKASLRAAHDSQAVEDMSHYHMARQIQETLAGMLVVLPPEKWLIYGRMEAAEFAGILRQVAMNVKPENFKKAKRGPKKKPPKKEGDKNTPHISTYKLINKRRP